jgi:hypothetical protein
MSNSILTSTKKILGIDENYTAFDADITMHINTVFTTLNQIGIGPASGFMIEDADAVWSDVINLELGLNAVKTYIYLKVKLLFDPPATSFHIAAMENQIRELEWRLNTYREIRDWIPPIAEAVLDGGTP